MMPNKDIAVCIYTTEQITYQLICENRSKRGIKVISWYSPYSASIAWNKSTVPDNTAGYDPAKIYLAATMWHPVGVKKNRDCRNATAQQFG